MSGPQYRPVPQPQISDDGQPFFQSPEMLQRPWRASSGSYTDAPGGVEMQQNLPLPHRPSEISFASDESINTQKPGMTETVKRRPLPQQKSFSQDSTMTTASFKAKTGRQLRSLLVGSSVRWVLSLLLCAAWVLATRLIVQEGAVTELRKRVYNAATTGIALALGLNIASAFKDMALNMRWPILAGRERNLVELDLILRADSLMELSKLVFATRRVGVIVAAIFWLLLNIAAQAAIAAVGLTYGFETDATGVILNRGNVSTGNMDHYYPFGNSSNTVESYEDESFTAHQYGSMSPVYGYNQTTELPKAGQRLLQQDGYVYYNNVTNVQSLVFFDYSIGAGVNTISVFTERTINITWECESHQVTAGGNGTVDNPTVADIGTIIVAQSLPNVTTFFYNDNTSCPHDNQRCSVIEVLEISETQPWYYRCNITLGQTQNDPQNLSFISDSMAAYTTAAIAQGGFSTFIDDSDETIQYSQIIPQSSYFGAVRSGDNDSMGYNIAYFSIGALAVASVYNPTKIYQGQTPTEGQQLTVGHAVWFIGILFLLLLFQAIFIIIVAIWANKVKVAEDSPLNLAVLMRPVADELDDISHGRETKALKKAKRHTKVRYEVDPTNGVWSFKIKNRDQPSTTSL